MLNLPILRILYLCSKSIALLKAISKYEISIFSTVVAVFLSRSLELRERRENIVWIIFFMKRCILDPNLLQDVIKVITIV